MVLNHYRLIANQLTVYVCVCVCVCVFESRRYYDLTTLSARRARSMPMTTSLWLARSNRRSHHQHHHHHHHYVSDDNNNNNNAVIIFIIVISWRWQVSPTVNIRQLPLAESECYWSPHTWYTHTHTHTHLLSSFDLANNAKTDLPFYRPPLKWSKSSVLFIAKFFNIPHHKSKADS